MLHNVCNQHVENVPNQMPRPLASAVGPNIPSQHHLERSWCPSNALASATSVWM